MTTRERTAAEIEAGFKRAFRDYEREHAEWSDQSNDATNWEACKAAEDRLFFLVRQAAADAVAAPAVGVTVDERVEHLRDVGKPINTPIAICVSLHDLMQMISFLYDEHGQHLPYAVRGAHDRLLEAAYDVARERDALLTAPKLGTDGGAG